MNFLFLKHKFLHIFLLLCLPVSLFSQCFEEAEVNFGEILDIAFVSNSNGYLTTKSYSYDDIDYLMTTDSGKNWIEVSTTTDFNGGLMECYSNRGVVFGKHNDTVAIEIFEDDIIERQMFLFPELNELLQMSIISTDTIVFLGKDDNDISCIGKIAIIDNSPEIIDLRQFDGENITQVYFDNQNKGWILIDENLHITEDFGVTSIEKLTGVLECDFYDENNFMYTTSSGLFCTYNSGLSSTLVAPSDELPLSMIDFILNFAPGLAWVGYTAGFVSTGTDFWLFDTNKQENLVISCNQNSANLTYKAYAYNENQIYFLREGGGLLYTLNNAGYTKLETNLVKPKENAVVYPNPATDRLVIDFESLNLSNKVSLLFYNALGQIILSKTVNYDENISVDVSGFRQGIYTIRVINGSISYTTKFIKE